MFRHEYPRRRCGTSQARDLGHAAESWPCVGGQEGRQYRHCGIRDGTRAVLEARFVPFGGLPVDLDAAGTWARYCSYGMSEERGQGGEETA